MKKLLIAILFLFPALAFAQVPAFPMAFWGGVTIDGMAAPSGVVVRAYYGSELAGSVTTQESGIYGYTGPTKQKLIVGEGSGAITFTVQAPGGAEAGGLTPVTYAQFASEETLHQDFAFSTQTQSSSGSGGGGGGGGSSGGGGSRSKSDATVTQGKVLGAQTVKATANGLTEAQIQAVLQLLQAFGADQTIFDNVTATLRGQASTVPTSVFARDLALGSTGEDVRALQQFLNRKGFAVASSGPGSAGAETTTFGPATRAALAKFQAANGITPALGYFGPTTRSFANTMK